MLPKRQLQLLTSCKGMWNRSNLEFQIMPVIISICSAKFNKKKKKKLYLSGFREFSLFSLSFTHPPTQDRIKSPALLYTELLNQVYFFEYIYIHIYTHIMPNLKGLNMPEQTPQQTGIYFSGTLFKVCFRCNYHLKIFKTVLKYSILAVLLYH